MLVAQNSLGPVCPVPLTVRGTIVDHLRRLCTHHLIPIIIHLRARYVARSKIWSRIYRVRLRSWCVCVVSTAVQTGPISGPHPGTSPPDHRGPRAPVVRVVWRCGRCPASVVGSPCAGQRVRAAWFLICKKRACRDTNLTNIKQLNFCCVLGRVVSAYTYPLMIVARREKRAH